MARRSGEIDMTSGPLLGKILLFAIPLALTGILQLLFNAVDIVVVGQFEGEFAVAAVGSTGSLINLIVCLFVGVSVGVNICLALAIGRRDSKSTTEIVHTAMTVALFFGIFVGLVGFLFAPAFLSLMGSPDDVIGLASLYMRIYFLGSPFFMIYTFGSAVMRSRGDTRRPMIYLMIAGASNVLLNLLLVVVFDMGVAGVALGTVLSHLVSSLLVVARLFGLPSDDPCRLRFSSLGIHTPFLLQMLRCGLPAGIQSALFSLSNVLIQSSINSLGPVVMAGNGAASNIEGFLYQLMYAFSYAAVSFVGQNVGAGKAKRTLYVLRDTVLLVFGVAIVVGAVLTALAPKLLLLYLPDAPDAVAAGVARMRVICRFYFLCGIMDTVCGAIRGFGRAVLPMVTSLVGACLLRIVWVMTVFAAFPEAWVLYISYPISWILTGAAHLGVFMTVYRKERRHLTKKTA